MASFEHTFVFLLLILFVGTSLAELHVMQQQEEGEADADEEFVMWDGGENRTWAETVETSSGDPQQLTTLKDQPWNAVLLGPGRHAQQPTPAPDPPAVARRLDTDSAFFEIVSRLFSGFLGQFGATMAKTAAAVEPAVGGSERPKDPRLLKII